MQPAKKEDGLESFLNEKNDITLKDLLKDAPFQQVRWHDLLAKAGFTESSEDERWRQKWLLSGANVRYYWLPLFQFDRTQGCFTCQLHLIPHCWNWQTRKHDLIEILGRRTRPHSNEDSRFCASLSAERTAWGQMILAPSLKVTQKGYTESWAMVCYLSLSLRGWEKSLNFLAVRLSSVSFYVNVSCFCHLGMSGFDKTLHSCAKMCLSKWKPIHSFTGPLNSSSHSRIRTVVQAR